MSESVAVTLVRKVDYTGSKVEFRGIEQVHLKIRTPEGEQQFRDMVARAINCWPEKPQWLQELQDTLEGVPAARN